MKHLLTVAFVFTSSVYSHAADADFTKPSANVKRFVTDVAYVVEAGDRDRITKRWVIAPQLVVNSTDVTLKSYVESAFMQLCQAAKLTPRTDTGAPKLSPGGDPSAAKRTRGTDTASPMLTVWIGPSRALAKEAQRENGQISLRGGHTYWTWWKDGTLTDAVVYLCTDSFKGAEAERALLTDLVSAFGFPATSKVFDTTILSSKRTQTTLTELDKMLFAFYYTHVPPGTKKPALSNLVEEHWGK
jgi:hypothetical protein